MSPLDLAIVAPQGEGALRARLGEATCLGFGGAEVQMALLGVGLSRRGHRVSFICGGLDPEMKEEHLAGVRLLRIPLGGPGRPRPRQLGRRIRQALDLSGARLVYQRCALPLTGRLAWVCSRSGRKLIFGVANDRDVDGRSRQALGVLRDMLYRYGLRQADMVIAQSDRQLEHLRARRTRPSIHIPSLFDMDGIRVRPEPGQPTLLWAGHLLAKKQPLLVLDLAQALPAVTFVAVGSPDVDRDLADTFRRRAASLANVEYLGQVPAAEMPALYDRASLFLNTSAAEGMPNTFLEAWARGIPVATLGIDPDDVLSRQELGWVLPEAAADRLRSILADADERSRRGLKGRAYVESRHGLSAGLTRFEEAVAALSPGHSG